MACFRQERNTLQLERLADWGVFMGELGTAVLVTAAAGIGGTGLGGGAAMPAAAGVGPHGEPDAELCSRRYDCGGMR